MAHNVHALRSAGIRIPAAWQRRNFSLITAQY
jgi:hypothetical protein